jgi:hypothetical protein
MSTIVWTTLITAVATVTAALGAVWIKGHYDDRTQVRQAQESLSAAQTDRRRQAYGELVMAARLALRNFRQLTFAYAVGTPDVSAVKDALSQTDSLTANVYQAAALTEIIASADGRRRARSIHDKTRDCADLFRSQELLSAIWPDLAVDKNLSSLSPKEIRKETPFDREEAKGHCDQLAAAIDQFIEAVNQELGQ